VKALVAALAVAAVAAAGCSGAGTPAPVAAATAAPATESAALTAALLAVADLPLGFQAQEGGAAAAALGCAGIDGVYLPGSAAHAAVSFAHSLTPAFVNETITQQSAASAAAAVTAFAGAVRSCAHFAGPDGTAYRVTAVGLPRYGDGSAALRVSSALAEGRPVELAAVRVGDKVVAIAAAGSGADDAALTRTVVERALAKLTRGH
jgi:trimeric autotransporter adhesin